MKLHAPTAITYDPDYIAPDFLDALEEIEVAPEAPLTAAAPGPLSVRESLSEDERERLLGAAWTELLASDVGAEIAVLPPAQQQALRARMLQEPQTVTEPEAVGVELASGLDRYRVEASSDGYTHLLHGRPILSIPLGAPAASEKSRKAAFIIAASQVAVDAVSLVLAATGVATALLNRSTAKATTVVASSSARAIAKNARLLSDAGRAASNLAKIQRALGFAKVIAGFPKITGILLSEMSVLEKTAAIASAVAALTLALASGGGSLWLSILAMTAAVTVFGLDLALAINRHKEWKG